MENYQVKDDIDKVLSFKNDYSHELDSFWIAIDKLSQTLKIPDGNIESIEKAARDVYKNDIQHALKSIGKALKGRRIKYRNSLIMRIATVSGTAPYLLSQLGNTGSPAIMATSFALGAGCLIGQSIVDYRADKKAEIDKSAVGYLFRINETFDIKQAHEHKLNQVKR